MSTSDSTAVGPDQLVKSLIDMEARRYELWKYFEDRADRLAERLWTIGIWLMAVIAATLALPFAAKFVVFPDTGFPIQVGARLPVALISVFGIAFLFYSYAALHDIQHHIIANWRRAIYARELTLIEGKWVDRKRHGWLVLLTVGYLALAAFVGLLVLALMCAPAR